MSKSAKPDTWMPFFIGDYRRDTTRLTTEQHGAYLLLIFDYWTNGPAPDDDDVLARITLLDRRAWLKARPAVSHFFTIEDGLWRHGRIDREIREARDRSARASAKAAAAAAARWGQGGVADDAPGNAPSIAQALHEECPPQPPIKKEPNGSVGSDAELIGRAVGELWSAAPKPARERSSRKDIERALRAALKRGHAAERVVAGVIAYFASPQATKDGGAYAKGVHRMIENDRWQEFDAPSATDEADGPSERQQVAWMEDWLESPFRWRTHERGPKPGSEGCRVDPAIQRRFGVEPFGERKSAA